MKNGERQDWRVTAVPFAVLFAVSADRSTDVLDFLFYFGKPHLGMSYDVTLNESVTNEECYTE